MKNRILLLFVTILTICSFAFSLTACANNVELEVNFIVDNEIYETVKAKGAEKIKMPKDPTKEGYVFEGWYWDEGVWEEPFTVNSLLDVPLTENISVYAKFNEEHKHEYISTVVDPTCSEDGYTLHACSCGDSYKDTLVEKIEHSLGEWVSNGNGTHSRKCVFDCGEKETKNCLGGTATCYQKANCSDCGESYGDFANHKPKNNWTTTDTHHYFECGNVGCNEKIAYAKHIFTN